MTAEIGQFALILAFVLAIVQAAAPLWGAHRGEPVLMALGRAAASLQAAFEGMGEAYYEQPIYGPAGTCVLYDTATFHTRLDGDGRQMRRTWHQYYARGGWLRSALPTTSRYIRSPSPALADWNLIPERLALHPDPKTRAFFSHWNTAQGEWAASGFDPEVRKAMPRGEQ